MKHQAIFIAAIFFIVTSLVSCQSGKNRCKGVFKDMEGVFAELQDVEKNLDKKIAEMQAGAEVKNCRDSAGLASIETKLAKIRKELDKLKPTDMPMSTSTIQTGLDPATQQPLLESNTTVDWGKVTGDDQIIWANLHMAHTGLAAALKTAEVACQCIESGDKNGLYCNVISIQMPDGKLNFDMESVNKAYFAPIRDIMAGKKGK